MRNDSEARRLVVFAFLIEELEKTNYHQKIGTDASGAMTVVYRHIVSDALVNIKRGADLEGECVIFGEVRLCQIETQTDAVTGRRTCGDSRRYSRLKIIRRNHKIYFCCNSYVAVILRDT